MADLDFEIPGYEFSEFPRCEICESEYPPDLMCAGRVCLSCFADVERYYYVLPCFESQTLQLWVALRIGNPSSVLIASYPFGTPVSL